MPSPPYASFSQLYCAEELVQSRLLARQRRVCGFWRGMWCITNVRYVRRMTYPREGQREGDREQSRGREGESHGCRWRAWCTSALLVKSNGQRCATGVIYLSVERSCRKEDEVLAL